MGHRGQEADLGLTLDKVLSKHFMDRKFEWYENDCCTATANALADLGHPALREHLDRSYVDKSTAISFISRAGGFPSIVGEIADALGFTEVEKPKAMSVGMIDYYGQHVLGLFDGYRFWLKGPRGVQFTTKFIKAFDPP